MAEASISWSPDQFSCSVCLDLLKDPVTVPCGHSYCMKCISDCWDQDVQKGVHSCPQCRKTFTPRPALFKNTMLADVVEKLINIKVQDVSTRCYSGPGDVECDVCTGRKHKAIKSCLVCLNSYCQTHLEQHETFFKSKKHSLTYPTGQLLEMICPQHSKILDIYCRTDQQCLCYLCMVDMHKNHEIVSSAAERNEKQTQLKETQKIYQERIKKMQTELQRIQAVVWSYKRSAQTAVDDSERIFTELISYIERCRSEVTQLIRDQEKVAVNQAGRVLERLEKEINGLKRRDAELDKLSRIDDHIQFLRSFQSLSVAPESSDSPSITVSSLLSFDDVEKSVSHLREKHQHFCREELEKLSDRVKHIEIIAGPEPKTREQFLLYSHELTLDPNTLNKRLRLSEENRTITITETGQQYPAHPDRFDAMLQGLCRESVCGRSYWEVEWSGGVCISVSYKSISRKGEIDESGFGFNDQSWGLSCSSKRLSFWHKNEWTDYSVESSYCRIGVYVDHRAGILSFYSISDTMSHIHSIHTTFAQPLYPGFRLSLDGKATICDLII